MRRISPLYVCGLLLCALALSGCGEDAPQAAEASAPPANPVATPWDSIPPQRLYGASPEENLRVVPVELDLAGIPEGWDGMRLAVLSDFQLGLWSGNERVAASAVRRAVQANADLVVLLGDYIAQGADTAALARVLAPLRGRRAVAVLGDRDIRSDSLGAAVARALSAQGIQVLRNGAVPIGQGGDTALVAGVDPELADKPWGDKQWVLSQLGGGAKPALVLSHNPQLLLAAPRGRFPGALAGNTFCGIVEVPGSPRLSWLSSVALPGAAAPGFERIFRLGNSLMFVTCGIGYGFVPVRFGAPPELALVTLRRVAATAQRQTGDTLSLDTLLLRYQRRDTAAADTAS